MIDRWAAITAAMLLCVASLPAMGANAKDAPKSNKPAETDGYDYSRPEPQPATESLDLGMYARIREEGLTHSHVMEYAGALFDDIGPRLTGSPNLAKANAWTRDQLTAMGCANAHLESWGEFGLGWRQISTSVDMVTPDTAVFIAQATPWSPATHGSITAPGHCRTQSERRKRLRRLEGQAGGQDHPLRRCAQDQPGSRTFDAAL